ncbi:S-layer homology domain-containing protein [Paenibacillus segetis]|uniref:SLH domain-containing protein n=1 Tax=Paenibacillus segetis TaxID=1325360 RepID=A0ABQ1YQM3_9BACL|nr:S-layer homology domain-containing protein [Paenibacillus segetis]GGH32888.1 hypothetical protein GCM10008013_37580 [Paenibacillus segetis]
MSNTSYSFKENSHMKVIQGGEKKVMKKILSVALSTAMAFSMFASVAFGADTAKLTPQQQFDVLKDAGIVTGYPDGTAGLDKFITRAELAKIIVKSINLEPITGVATYKDKNYTASHWAAPYIEAATQAGILEGKNLEKKLFDPTGNVTVQELAKVLVSALKLEVPADTNNTATEWAKGYVEAAIKAGYLDAGLNYQANATRSQVIVAAHAVYEFNNFKVVKAEASDATHVKLTLSTGEVVDVVLEKALEANKATELTYKAADGRELKYTVTWVVTTATKVEKAAASNLKEVVVTFDGEVDQESAEEVANYSLRSGKLIDSVSLSEDKLTATILLAEGSVLSNNKVEAVSVSNIKAGDKTVSVKNLEFTTVDNVLPEVSSVKSLGTKSVKVVFSEPVNGVAQSNFKIDGKEFFGKVSVSANNRTVILTPFNTSALAVGEHKINVSGVKDFAGFVSLASTTDITVVEDKDAPTITEASATLESVTLTFSEDVDYDTVKVDNVYWKSSTDKIKAVSKKQLADNKVKFTFGPARSLPTGAVSIFVEGVKDYSGNEIAKDTSVVVTPEIDQTRPVVKKVTAESATQIKIVLSKEINAASAGVVANYIVKDKDGKAIAVKDAKLDPADLEHRTVLVNLYTKLSVSGDNTLTIQNLKDNTKLQNTILDYTGKVSLADKTAPKIDSKVVNTVDKRVVVTFDKKMDVESLASYSNYLVVIDNKVQSLTSDIAEITVLQDGQSVAIKFADSIGNKVTVLGSNVGAAGKTYITELRLLNLKDTNGNVLQEFADNSNTNFVDLKTSTVTGLAENVKLVDRKTVKVKFNAGIIAAGSYAFVSNTSNPITSVDVDSTSVVTIGFANDLQTNGGDLNFAVNLAYLTTTAGGPAGAGSFNVTSANVKDEVKPSVVLTANDNLLVSGNNVVVNLSEPVKATSNEVVAAELEITRNFDQKKLKAEVDYTVTGFTAGATTSTFTIELLDSSSREIDTYYTVSIKNSKFITDVADNELADFSVPTAVVTGTAAPAGLTGVNTGFTGANSGKITGLDATKNYEIKLESAPVSAYTAVPAGTEISGLAAGTYNVRIAAIAANPATGAPAIPASAAAKVTVGTAAPSDTEALAADVTSLVTAVTTVDPAAAITANITVSTPATGANGSVITWKANALAHTATTFVTPARTASSQTVTLEATITKGTEIPVVKTFTITIPAGAAAIDITVAP